jgi:DNA-binding NarL/FixJ family response regulator
MSNIRVFLVEDDEDARNYLASVLSSSPGIEFVQAFPDGESFLGANIQPMDIVIMDIGLPGISGIQAMLQMQLKYPGAQYIMFTIFEDDDHLFEALKAGADGYFLKKDTIENFIRAIFELHEGGAPMSKSIARKVLEFLRPRKRIQILSAREIEVLDLLAKGLLYKEIADLLFISEGTVKQHVNHIYGKLHVQNRTEAINKYLGRM